MWPSVAIAVSSEVARAEGAAIGVVTDLTGIPIPGVRVRLSCPGEPARLATSGHQGAYRFDDVPAKVCALTVSKRGFDRVKVRGVALDHAYVTVVPTVRLSEALRSAGEIVLHPAYGAVYAGGEVRTWLPEPERLPLHQRFGLASSLVTRPAPTADRRYRQVVNGVDVTDVFGERSVSLLRDDDVQLVATSGGGALDPGGDVVSAWLPMPEPVWDAQVLWEPAAAGVRAGVSGGGSVGHAGTLGAEWGYQRTEVAGDALSAHRARVNALAEVDGNHVSVEGMVEPSSYEGSGDTRALALGATRWRWYASRSVATDLSVSALRHTTVTGADTRAQMTQAARGAVTARPGDHAVGVGFGGSRTDAERVTAPSSAWYVTGARGWAFVNEAWRPSVFDVQGGARLDVIRVAHADDVLSTVDLSPRVSVGVSPGRSTAVSVSAARYGPMTDLDPVRMDDEVAVVLDPSAGRQVDALTAAWDQAFGAGVLRADVQVQRASGPDGSARAVQGAVVLDMPDGDCFGRARWVGTAGLDGPAATPHVVDGYIGWQGRGFTVTGLAGLGGPWRLVGARVSQDVWGRADTVTFSAEAVGQRGEAPDPWSPMVGPWAVLVGASVAR